MRLGTDDVIRLAAFSDADSGGNPAGVVIVDSLPDATAMRALAARVGYSETAFAAPVDDAWRVRYFSPESEVPFCGHATIALGAALAERAGDGIFELRLNETVISVEGTAGPNSLRAALQSPPTSSEPADPELVARTLALFGYVEADLEPTLPPLVACAGATHLVLALGSREKLAAMRYDLDAGRELMNAAGLVTIALVHECGAARFDTRNAFASGGVFEDPATGAAAAALTGAIRDRNLRPYRSLTLVQGEDMGARSIIFTETGDDPGTADRVSGQVRRIR